MTEMSYCQAAGVKEGWEMPANVTVSLTDDETS